MQVSHWASIYRVHPRFNLDLERVGVEDEISRGCCVVVYSGLGDRQPDPV